jgi:hypothetical protein
LIIPRVNYGPEDGISIEMISAAVRGFGIVISLGLMVLIPLFCFYKKIKLSDKNIIFIGALSCFVIPFVLPGMHDRYLMMADVFFFILLFYDVRYLLSAILCWSVSIYGYLSYLNNVIVFSVQIVSVIYLVSIVLMGYQFYKIIKDKNNIESIETNNVEENAKQLN